MSRTAYSINKLLQITGGELLISENREGISSIVLDSRKISNAHSALFIAIKGERHDAHNHLQDVIDSGGRTFIIERDVNLENLQNCTVIRVASSIVALQQMAQFHREKVNFPILGITGSNGKTIVKEWLNQMLSDDYTIVRSPRSYNSQIGVPLSVWNIEEQHTLGIFEAGISKVGEMEKLSSIIRPDYGILCNVGKAHIENFSSKDELAKEKIKLFDSCHTLVYRSDYPEIEAALSSGEANEQKRISWSTEANKEADFKILSTQKDSASTHIEAIWKDEFISFKIPFTDEASFENAVHCIVFLLVLDYSKETINTRLQRLSSVAMRMELLEGKNDTILVSDVYSSDLNSLQIGLDFLKRQGKHSNRILILSDIPQTGLVPKELYSRVNKLITAAGINQLIAIGDSIALEKDIFSLPSTFFKTTQDFIEQIDDGKFESSDILIKGARAYQFEKITQLLQQKTHNTVLEINLDALVDNLNHYRQVIGPEVKIMVMVKAFSYGSGSHEIANLLQFNQVDYLGVAYTDEGIALRQAGISLPIMVMNPEASGLDAMINHKLEPEIYSLHSLKEFAEKTALREGEFFIHLKVDTGMHRLGFSEEDIDELLKSLEGYKNIRIRSVFSHLAAADDADYDSFSKSQMESFETMANRIEAALSYHIVRHLANSAGIIRFPEARYDMVRLGIGLYGIQSGTSENELRNVSTLKSVISQIKHIRKGDSVGYGRSYIANKDIVSATIPIGYADGLSRLMGNKNGEVLLHGKRAAIIGNVCMDMIMIDISEIPANEGDEVIVFGEDLPITELSEKCGTIPYEIFTSISQRVKRVYIQD